MAKTSSTIPTATLLVTYAVISAAEILHPAVINKNSFPTTPEAESLLALAAAEFDVLKLEKHPMVRQLVEDIKSAATDSVLTRMQFKKEVCRILDELRRMEWEVARPRRPKASSLGADVGSYPDFPGWHKDEDGEWRNPRYSSNTAPHDETFRAEHDVENGCAVITHNGVSVPVSLRQLHHLNGQTQAIVRQIQDQNSALYPAKAQIGFLDYGRLEPRPARASF